MASFDWQKWVGYAKDRSRNLPIWVWVTVFSVLLAAIMLVFFLNRGPTYTPLYEGLSSKQGGQVIEQLQKLGIQYQLDATGSIISVPSPQLAQARLQLGQMDVPHTAGSEAWDQLTNGSMTTSQTAQDALSRRSLENTLENTIVGMSGVVQARVTLAVPESTPFLKDQPDPKASIWLKLAPDGLENDSARAIAQLVSKSVTGLSIENVTVTDQSGNILAPAVDSGLDQASRQLAFTSDVETRAQHHIEALLQPMIGPDNVRVSAAANINYGDVSRREVSYGDKPTAKRLRMSSTRGLATGPGSGVPGSLSNQPPGNTDAPVAMDDPDQADEGGQDQEGTPAETTVTRDAGDLTEEWNVEYQVDQATTVTHRAPWQLDGLSVSIVLNESAVGNNGAWVAKIEDIISHALEAPDLKINVAVVPFGVEQTAVEQSLTWQDYLKNQSVMRALMALLAALLILFGIAKPLARWLRESVPVPSRPSKRPIPAVASDESQSNTRDSSRAEHAQRLASARPKETAEMIRQWINESGDEGFAANNGEPQPAGDSQ